MVVCCCRLCSIATETGLLQGGAVQPGVFDVIACFWYVLLSRCDWVCFVLYLGLFASYSTVARVSPCVDDFDGLFIIWWCTMWLPVMC